MKVPKMSMRVEDIEVRSCGDSLLVSGVELTTAEILQWFQRDGKPEYCIALAYWRKKSEGYELGFVGRRPLDVSPDAFMRAVKYGQEFLDCCFAEARNDY